MAKRNFSQPSSTASQAKFAQVPKADINRSKFDRSHGLKTTFGRQQPTFQEEQDNGLVPIFVDEVLPGDTFNMKATAFMRLATPLHPVMDNLFVDMHFWFVPYRLVWDNWQYFMGERRNPGDDPADYSIPQQAISLAPADEPTPPYDRLFAYMGLPFVHQGAGSQFSRQVNALPFRAYRLIWNEWYRDQNLQDSVDIEFGDAVNPASHGEELLPRGKRKDYFTSALPWPQKGDPVVIPMHLEGVTQVYGNPAAGSTVVETQSGVTGSMTAGVFREQGGGNFNMLAGGANFLSDEWSGVQNEATINDLRTAFQIQKLLERDARGGTRYIELIKSHFGVTSSDARLQRPEYLGGGTSRISQNPVANTAGGTDPQGNLSAYGTGVNQATFSKSFDEHGIVLGLVSYRADLTYQRGIERMWSRQSRFDFYWPALAHLGEQAILNREIHHRGVSEDDDVFGYQERYGEYRYKPSRTTGLFNSDSGSSLDVWHLAQDFPIDQPLPLNENFIKELPPVDRVIAVQDEPWFLADLWFDLQCQRPMPVYAVPGLVDHF